MLFLPAVWGEGLVALWIAVTVVSVGVALLLGALVKRPPREPLIIAGLLSYPGVAVELVIVAIVWWRRRYTTAA